MALNLAAGIKPVPGYELVRLLGRGGFGEVWEALAPGDVRVALKFIRLYTAEAGPEQRALAVIRDIRHPHLLDIQFASQVDDCLVLAMPLCERTLADRFRQCREAGLPGIPRDELLGYMDDLARAVDFLNEPRHEPEGGLRAGIQHRDIKPNNIFLVGDSVRLADFGLAKILAASTASHTGAMSPNYVAPEVIEGRVSARSDQYSVAVTYVQLRVGRLPFSGGSIPNLLFAHLQEQPDLSELPEEEQTSVARALAKRPEDRWPSCRAFVNDLKQAAAAAAARLSAEAQANDLAATLTGAAKSPIARGAKPADTRAPRPFAPSGDLSGTSIPFELATVVNAPAVSATEPAAAAAAPRPRRLRLVVLTGLAAACAAAAAAAWLFPRSGPASAGATQPLAEPVVAAVVPTAVADPIGPGPAPAPKATPALPEATTRRPDRPVVGEPITNSIGMRLVLLPAGEFVMGASERGGSGKAQGTRVRILQPFYLGAREVTQGEFERVMQRKPSKFSPTGDRSDAVGGQDTREYPVESVSWDDAVEFCNELSRLEHLEPYYGSGRPADPAGGGYRLPSEAEWEYGCRAGSEAAYAFGDETAELGKYAWFAGNSGQQPHATGQKEPNAFGLYDMHGNVWEWCLDEVRLGGSRDEVEAEPPINSRATDRIYRGGGYNDGPRLVRAGSRARSATTVRDSALGFRVARGAGRSAP